MDVTIGKVQDFWNSNPCQWDLSCENERCRYFEEISRRRFEGREWHVPLVANFEGFRGKKLLEVGCGIATDGLEFARNGTDYTGIDLTPRSIELAKERFALFGISGQFEVANAEKEIPFPDSTFDHVYSFGVIHHSPSPEKIVSEIHRVLKRGGSFTVMVYNRTSINYYVEIMFLRKIFRRLLLPKFMPGLIARITGFDRWKLEGHREIVAKHEKISKDEWISMNTDGPFCPLARVYDKREAAALFNRFEDVRQEIWEWNVDHWPFIRKLLPQVLAQRVGRLWGWHRIIYGNKP